MLLCFKRDFVAFQHLLIDRCAARPVQFIAQKLIGWAGCGTKSAVNTGAQELSASSARAFCRISSVNWVCIACSSEFRVHATGVKHAARVELLFKLLVMTE